MFELLDDEFLLGDDVFHQVSDRDETDQLAGVHDRQVAQAVGVHLTQRAKAGDRAPGAIVNVSSDAGRRGTVGQINYGAAKSGILGLTMSSAREWARFGIRVNSVCFGVVETPMTEVVRGEKFRDQYLAQIPMGRWATTDEVTPPICFLLSNAASYITGQHLSVNGGFHIEF